MTRWPKTFLDEAIPMHMNVMTVTRDCYEINHNDDNHKSSSGAILNLLKSQASCKVPKGLSYLVSSRLLFNKHNEAQ